MPAPTNVRIKPTARALPDKGINDRLAITSGDEHVIPKELKTRRQKKASHDRDRNPQLPTRANDKLYPRSRRTKMKLKCLRGDAPQVVETTTSAIMDAKAARIEDSNVVRSSRWLGANRRDLRPRLTRL